MAIMSLTAILNRPPVSSHQLTLNLFSISSKMVFMRQDNEYRLDLLPKTIWIYSSSDGHVKLSRQNRSNPWPLCSCSSSSIHQLPILIPL